MFDLVFVGTDDDLSGLCIGKRGTLRFSEALVHFSSCVLVDTGHNHRVSTLVHSHIPLMMLRE